MIGYTSASIIGTIVSDPVERSVGGDKSLVEFALAVNEPKGQGEEKSSFYDIVVWGEREQEKALKFFKKGTKLFAQCSFTQDKWADKETGKSRSKVQFKLIASRLLSPKKEEEDEPF